MARERHNIGPAGNGVEPVSEEFFEYALRMTRHRIRLVDVLSSVLLIAAVATALLLGMVLADHLLQDGLGAGQRRMIRWGAAAVLLGLTILTLLLPLIKRINDLYVARMIEQANPGFRNDLTAALQLRGQDTLEEASLRAVLRRASRQTAQTDVEQSVNLHGLKVAGGIFIASVLAFLFYGMLSPKPILLSVRRAIGQDHLPAPTYVVIEDVLPRGDGADRVLTGRTVEFSARVRRADGPVLLRISRDGGTQFLDDDTLRMSPPSGEDTRYRATWPAAATDGTAVFEIVCGDATSGRRTLRVLPPPRLEALRMTHYWPAYTGQALTETTDGTVNGLVGMQVGVEARTNLPVDSASLVFQNAEPVLLQAESTRITGRFTIRGTDQYRIEYRLAGEVGREETLWHEIRAATDQPPHVTLTEPMTDVEVATNQTLLLRGEATDDLGLGRVELVSVSGETETPLPLSSSALPGSGSQPFRRAVEASDLGRAGDVVMVYVRARDFCPMEDDPTGQVGKSRAVTVTLRDPLPEQTGEQEQADLQKAQAEQARENPNPDNAPNNAPAPQDGNLPAEPPLAAHPDLPMDPAKEIQDALQTDPADAAKLDKLRDALDEADPAPQVDPAPPAQQDPAPPAQPQPPAGQQPGDQAPGGQAPGGQAPGGQAPGGQAPGGQAPGGQAPGGQAPGGQAPGGQAPGGQAPGGQAPGGQASDKEIMHEGEGSDVPVEEEERGDVEDVQADPLGQTPSGDTLESLGRALDAANAQIAENKVDPALLKDLNMTEPEFRTFVEQYTHVYEKAVRQAKANDTRQTLTVGQVPLPGQQEVQHGQGVGVGALQDDGEPHSRDDEEIGGGDKQSVSPEYRKQLEAFLRATSQAEVED